MDKENESTVYVDGEEVVLCQLCGQEYHASDPEGHDAYACAQLRRRMLQLL